MADTAVLERLGSGGSDEERLVNLGERELSVDADEWETADFCEGPRSKLVERLPDLARSRSVRGSWRWRRWW